jgi:guanylate kinase
MMKKGLLIVISGPSGSGKTTICRNLIRMVRPSVFSISATTRHPRPGEKDGKDYYFLTEKQFQQKIRKGELLEWATVYEHHYGTPRKPVLENLRRGVNVLLDIDMQGALQVKEKYPQALLIFILPPSLKAMKQRLLDRRQDSQASINLRVQKFQDELKYIPRYDHLVVNEDLSRAMKIVKKIVEQKKSA